MGSGSLPAWGARSRPPAPPTLSRSCGTLSNRQWDTLGVEPMGESDVLEVTFDVDLGGETSYALLHGEGDVGGRVQYGQ